MTENGQCKPIFVVGHHRSGTSWVTNLLESHSDVYTPTHREHNGQHESAFFSCLLPYCRWGRTKQDRHAIRAIFECSDYWHLLFPRDPPEIDACGKSPDAYFRACMDVAARRRGCGRWVEKTPQHTLLLGYLLRTFPDASFVAVERDRQRVIHSYLARFKGHLSLRDWAARSMDFEIYRKVVNRYRGRVITIRYEDLLAKREQTLQILFGKLGLDVPEQSKDRWAANSSFTSSPARLSLPIRMTIESVHVFFVFVPSAWCEKFGLRRFRAPEKQALPGWFFRVFNGRFAGSRGAD